MSDQKNFLYAFVLSFSIFFLWDHFFGVKPVDAVKTETAAVTKSVESETISLKEEDLSVLPHEEAIKGLRLQIENEHLQGSINLKGAILDDLTLLKYNASVNDESSKVKLLLPQKTENFYYVDFSFLTDSNIEKPGIQTDWMADNLSVKLTPQNPVTLFFENSQNIRFERTYSIDNQYMITIQQRIVNKSNIAVNVQNKSSIKRKKPNLKDVSYILHEGSVGYINNRLIERDYEKMSDVKHEEFQANGGWIGFSDKYWLVALLANSEAKSTFSIDSSNNEQFDSSLKNDVKNIQPGESFEQTLYLYAGPKKLDLLDKYEENYNVKNLDLAIDFGWFYFFTKPLFQFLDWLYQIVGNFGIAILIMTLLSKILLFPLANKSYYSMGRMKKLSPKMEEIKKRYEKDPVKMQQEIMALYKKEKVNPLSGCLPMLIQAPIFFCLYKVLYISIEMRHAPFYGWIKDLSAKDPTSLFNLFGLLPWQTPDFLTIGLLPLIMGGTMIWQQKLNPQPTDDTQAKMMLLMPIFFTFIFASFPSGLVIYWTFSNILSIIQQRAIMNIAAKKNG